MFVDATFKYKFTMTQPKKDISTLRQEYSQNELNIEATANDPIEQFQTWFDEALDAELIEPNAMTLSTADEDGMPSGRIVLLKEFDHEGFVFYTNYNSKKGHELASNPYAALTFFWLPLERQVRIKGRVQKVSDEENDNYFYKRPLGSQKAAIASHQSRQIENKSVLIQKLRELDKMESSSIKRPMSWGGYRVKPYEIEFWQGRPNRVHDRILYHKHNKGWNKARLAP